MGFLTAGESVHRMAAYCRIEQLLFGLLGGWVVEIEEPNAKLAMLATADHCAWRSKRWFEMLPTAPPGPDALIVATSAELETFANLVEIVGASQNARVVAAYQHLLPALRAAMVSHLEVTTEVADAPIRRMLGLAIFDLDNDLRAGSASIEADGELARDHGSAAQIGVELTSQAARISLILGG